MNQTIQLSLLATLLLSTHLTADEQLEQITVISATKSTQNLQNVTSNINIITAQEIEERHYTTITQALNSIAGVSFTSNGGLGKATSVNLRGFDSKRVLVLIDGIRYNDITGLSGAPFEHLMIDDIEQIEVIKGATSGVWGADASAGVINIITKKAQEGFHIHASGEFGSFETSKSHANLSYRGEHFYLKASHNRVQTNGFSAVAPRGEDLDDFEDDGYKNNTTSLQAGFEINTKNKIDISHTIINATSEGDAYDNAIYSFDPNSQYNSKSKHRFSKINYHHVDDFNELDIFAKRSKFSREYPDDTFSKNFDGEINEYGLTSKIPYRSEDFIVWGGEFKEFEHQNSIDKKYDNRAFFVTNSNSFGGLTGGKTIFTQSIRQDNYSDFDNKLTGKLGLKHIHTNIEGFSTSLNYGTAYNVPTHYNLYDPFSGNSSLTPEETKGYDVTLEYKNLKATYFDNTIEEMIDYQSNYDADGNWIGGNYQNVKGKSKIKGFEIAYSQEILSDTLLSMSYTNLDAKDRDGKTLTRRAKENLKFAVDYYGISRLHLGIDGEYVGERYDQADKQGQQTGKYTTANFTANYEVDAHMSIYTKVENITDKYYQTIDGYSTSPRAIYGGMKLSY